MRLSMPCRAVCKLTYRCGVARRRQRTNFAANGPESHGAVESKRSTQIRRLGLEFMPEARATLPARTRQRHRCHITALERRLERDVQTGRQHQRACRGDRLVLRKKVETDRTKEGEGTVHRAPCTASTRRDGHATPRHAAARCSTDQVAIVSQSCQGLSIDTQQCCRRSVAYCNLRCSCPVRINSGCCDDGQPQ